MIHHKMFQIIYILKMNKSGESHSSHVDKTEFDQSFIELS